MVEPTRPIMYHRLNFGGVVTPQGAIARGGSGLKEEIAAAKLALLRKPLTEAPFGDDNNRRVAAFAASIDRLVKTGPKTDLPLVDKLISVLIDIMVPLEFQMNEGRFFKPENDVYFALADIPAAIRPRVTDLDVLPTPGYLLSIDPVNTLDGNRIRPFKRPEEILLIAIATLRHLLSETGLEAYFTALITPVDRFNRQNVIQNPGIAILDTKQEPHLRTFILHDMHPPMSELHIFSDEAVLSFLHALDALNRLRRFQFDFETRPSKRGGFLWLKDVRMSSEEFEASVRNVCAALKTCFEIWNESPIGTQVMLELMGSVGRSYHGLIKKELNA
ncbi:hypothetical protein J4450_06350 [Candidatus Micrarchaeota archaeon]|nr:hypothetical protein [Candidatus Micrarchaeota archaeon]